MINSKTVIAKTKRLIDKMGIPKSKLGQVLYNNSSKNQKANEELATKFLNNQLEISIDHLNRLSDFFEKPTEWFIFENYQINQETNQSHNDRSVIIGDNGMQNTIIIQDYENQTLKKFLETENTDQKIIIELLNLLKNKS